MSNLKRNTVLLSLLLAILLLIPSLSNAQLFTVNGDASDQGGGCYELTPNGKGKLGSIWSPNKVSLNNSFVVTGRLNFGTKPFWERGADGIAFTLQPISTNVGNPGAALGVGGISPALVVEFDTYENGWDPSYHHAAIVQNGEPDHVNFAPLDGPVGIKAGNGNVTDGQWYNCRFEWDAVSQKFTVDINCIEILSYSGDMIQDVFGGVTDVHWGFSAATGDKYSHHQVCVDATNLTDIPDQTMCLGDTATVALTSLGNNYTINSWNPTVGIISTSATAPNATYSPSANTEYILTLTDVCNEEIKDTFNLTIDPAPPVSLGNDTNICGTQNITLDAGNAGSTYLWSTGAISQTINTTGAGTYFVEVTNLAGCSASDTIVVGSGGGLIVNLGPDSSFCGAINLSLDAGNIGNTYLWNTGAVTQNLEVSTVGSYFVEITATSGCKGHDTILVSQVNQLVVSLGNDTSVCAGNNITFDAGNAGNTYLWNTGNNTQSITVETAGTYGLIVTNPAGCQGTDSITLTTTALPVVNLGTDLTLCSGDSIALDAGAGGSTYLWNTTEVNQTISANTGGTYYVDVTSNNCSSSDTIFVTMSSAVVRLGNDTTICSGASLVLDAANLGSTYLWNTTETSQDINVSLAGTYDVLVTDANNCQGRDTLIVITGASPILDLGQDITSCTPINSKLDANNVGSTFVWNTGATAQTINVNSAGLYYVDVTNAANCATRDSITISLSSSNMTVDLGGDSTFCGNIFYTRNAANPGSTYEWNTGDVTQSINITAAGQYYVKVTDGSGCIKSDTVNINLGSPVVLDLGNDQNICEGTTVTLDALNNGSTFLWSDGSTKKTLSVVLAGSYSATVSNSDNCEATDQISIIMAEKPVINMNNSTNIACVGDTVIVSSGNSSDAHLWSDGTTNSTTNVTNGHHILTLTLTNALGCTTTGTALPVNFENISVDLIDVQYHCTGTTTILNPNSIDPNYTYTWQSPGDNIDGGLNTSSDGTHVVTALLNIGTKFCSASDSTTLISVDYPNIVIQGDSLACEGESITLDVIAINSALWSDGSTGNQHSVTSTGVIYASTSLTSNGKTCTTTDSLSVRFDPFPEVIETKAFSHCFEYDRNFTIFTNIVGDNYEWSHSISSAPITGVQEKGIYSVTVYNNINCPVTQEIEVNEKCPLSLFVPNSFSPNGDGINETFAIVGHNAETFELTIFNRWGEIVFQSSAENKYWNGTINGHILPQDIYVWMAKITGYDENYQHRSIEKTGTITLVR